MLTQTADSEGYAEIAAKFVNAPDVEGRDEKEEHDEYYGGES
jgi:hypothetical protein